MTVLFFLWYQNIAGPKDPFTHFVAVIVPTFYTNTLVWNGQSIANGFPSATWTTLPGTFDLSTTWFQVQAGVQDVYSTIPNVQFLVLMAGYAPQVSYGTIAGSRCAPINAVRMFKSNYEDHEIVSCPITIAYGKYKQ